MSKAGNKEARKRRQSRRNWAVFAALALFILLVYGVTMVKIALGYGGYTQ